MRRAAWVLWGMCGVFVLAVVGVFAWTLLNVEQDDPFRTTSDIGCDKALNWAHGKLPESARDQDCEFSDWMDDLATGSFRMARGEVDGWVRAHWPTAEAGLSCDEADLCRSVEFVSAAGVPVEGYGPPGPVMLTIEVTYEDATNALIEFEAWSS